MKKIIFLLLCGSSLAVNAFELRSKVEEGALTYGKLNKGEKLFLNDTEIISTKSGFFFFGLPQDTKKISLKLIHNDGKIEEKHIDVQKRNWKEDYVTGLQPEKVSPNKQNSDRIQKENLLIKKARNNFNKNYFPFCFDRPVKNYKRISSPFGARRILNNIKKQGHSGVDYAAPTGTNVYAPADGIVSFVHQDMFLTGKTLLINHGYGLFSSYSHLNHINVKEGDKIKQGEIIAQIGSTGRSTGPHLHYTITWNGVRLDPEQQINDFPCKK